MDVCRSSLPPKLLVPKETDAELRPNAETPPYMAAHGCHFVKCIWYVLLINIESYFLTVRSVLRANRLV